MLTESYKKYLINLPCESAVYQFSRTTEFPVNVVTIVSTIHSAHVEYAKNMSLLKTMTSQV